MLNYIIVIPARLKSTRLPNKPLLKIKSVPMIIRTAIRCNAVANKSKILIATDSKKITKLCKENNFKSILLVPSQVIKGNSFNIGKFKKLIDIPTRAY